MALNNYSLPQLRPFDIDPVLRSFDQGIQTTSRLAEAAQQREAAGRERSGYNASIEAGRLLAAGDRGGAESALLKAGKIGEANTVYEQGAKREERDREKQLRAMDELGGLLYGVNDPGEYETVLRGYARKHGMDENKLLSENPFENREANIRELMGGKWMMEQEAKRSKSGTGRLGEVYDETTGQPRKVWIGPDGAMTPVGGVRAPEKREAGLSVIEKKAVFEAEDDLPAIEATIDALNRALELNSKTFEGITAGARGAIGTSNIPGANLLLDRKAAEATREWGQTMNMEAIKSMAASLKGATTNFELSEFVRILADPTSPPDIRERIIKRMLTLAKRQQGVKQQRIKELRATGLKPSGAAAPQSDEPAQGEQSQFVNPDTGEIIQWNGEAWERMN